MLCHRGAFRVAIRLVAIALLAVIGSGCTSIDWAGMNWNAGRGDDVALLRKQRLIEEAGRFDKHREEAQWQAALARLRAGNLDRARDQLAALLVRNPDHPDARALLDEINASQSAIDPTVESAVRLAVDALQSNQPDVALGILHDALARFPESAVLWRVLGAAHHQGGAPQSAQSALHQALSLDNSSPLAYFLLGQSLRSQGQQEQATRYFQAAADLDGRYAM